MHKSLFLAMALAAAGVAHAGGSTAAYQVTASDLADPTGLGTRMGSAAATAYGTNATANTDAQGMLGGPASVTVTGSSPAKDTVGVSGTSTATLTSRCGSTLYALGLAVRNVCTYANNKATGMKLAGCVAAEAGGSCRDTDYTADQLAYSGQTATFGKHTVKVSNCTSTGCKLTVTNTDSLSEQGSGLNSKASNMALSTNANSAQGSVQTVYRSGTYNAQMGATGSQFGSCVAGVTAGAPGGTVSSCDGSSTAAVGSVTSSGTCETLQQCIQYAVTSNYWYEACDRSVSTTTLQCNSGFLCSQGGDPVEEACTEKTSVEVRATINCTSGEFFDIGQIRMSGLYSGDGDYEDGKWVTMQAKCEPHRADGMQVFRFKPGQNFSVALPTTEHALSANSASISEGKLIWEHYQKKLTYSQVWAIPSDGCTDTTCTYAFVSTWHQYPAYSCDNVVGGDGGVWCGDVWYTHYGPETVFQRYDYVCSSGTNGETIVLYPDASYGGNWYCYHTTSENPFQSGCTSSSTDYTWTWYSDSSPSYYYWTNPEKCVYRPGYFLGYDTAANKKYAYTRTNAYQPPGWTEHDNVAALRNQGWLMWSDPASWRANTLSFERPRVVYREYETTDGGCAHLR